MRPIAVVAPNPNPQIISGQLIHDRLIAAQVQIQAAHDKKKKKAAQKVLVETAKVWETYNKNPTIDNWNRVQTVGNGLDVALRGLK